MSTPFSRPGLPSPGALNIQAVQPTAGPPVDVLQQNAFERLYWPLYDLQVATATTNTSQFFAAVPTDIRLGNIERPNTLPKPQAFAGRAIAIAFQPGVLQADATLLIRSGVLVFEINNRLYFRLPISSLGGMSGLYVSAAATTVAALTVAPTALGLPTVQSAHYFPVPFVLQGEEVFNIRIEWRLALTGITDTDITCYLLGLLQRKPTGQ